MTVNLDEIRALAESRARDAWRYLGPLCDEVERLLGQVERRQTMIGTLHLERDAARAEVGRLRAAEEAAIHAYHDLRDAVLALCDRYENADKWLNPPSGQTVAAKFHATTVRAIEGES